VKQKVEFAPEQQFYQAYSAEEDKERTNVHYEQPVEFFYAVTGGRWNVYSCNIWDEGAVEDDTTSQEAKLDLMAEQMDLKPGMRILDVGCGWGGPLTYLCKKYGVTGVGLTLSPAQKKAADERAAREGVADSVEIIECHWRDYAGQEASFDAVYTDEVIVHFNDLGGFFEKAYSVLREGGRMVNKELHFTHKRYAEMTRGLSLINEIYGSTGNYRPLGEELTLANDAGFDVIRIHQMPLHHYRTTMAHWVSNMWNDRARLEEMVGKEYFKRFRAYLKVCLHIFHGQTMTLDIVVSRKAPKEEYPTS
jgi:cyclopropane-fatty-acyl-phospholipid synthase